MARSDPIEWLEELPCSVTVCDADYTVLYLNGKSAESNAKDGGKDLVGTDLMDCHPEEAQKKLRKVMASGKPNVYTVERNGVRKMVYQAHWRKKGRVGGLVEVVFDLPPEVPHFVRK